MARELELKNEFSDINIQNLIPEQFQKANVQYFLDNLDILDTVFKKIKEEQKPAYVLRYVGDLSGNLQREKGNLEVKLISVPKEKCFRSSKGSRFYYRNLYRVLW